MPNLTKDLSFLKEFDPSGKLHDLVRDMIRSINNIGSQTNAHPVGTAPAPPNVAAVNVVASSGVHDITIQDSTPANRGLHYFVEWDTTPNFSNPKQKSLGPDRNWRTSLGVSGPVYFRAYSSYQTSPPSEPVYAGTPATPQGFDAGSITLKVAGVTAGAATVNATGVVAGPTPPATTGSGTEPSLQPQPSAGFGFGPVRESTSSTPELAVRLPQ